MSKNVSCIGSRAIARDLWIAALLVATMGLVPGVAAAGPDAGEHTAKGLLLSVKPGEIVLQRSTEPDLRLTLDEATNVAMDGRSASSSDLREGDQVRAAYQETDGVARAIRIDGQRGETATTVQTMSPDDPAWDQVHQGG